MNPRVSLAASGNIALEIPSVLAEGRSHTVEIPLSLAGLSLLKKILVERAREPVPSLGKKSSPVAADIHAFMERRDRENNAAVISKYNIEIDL